MLQGLFSSSQPKQDTGDGAGELEDAVEGARHKLEALAAALSGGWAVGSTSQRMFPFCPGR